MFESSAIHCLHSGCVILRAVFKGRDFFFCSGPPLRTAPRDHQPPTANHQPPPTADRRQPPAATNRQPPTTANRHQPPTTNHQSPTTNRCQPPPTATNHQLPTANRQPPPTANRQPPPTMVEHMECPRAFLGKLVPEHFFFPLRTALVILCCAELLCSTVVCDGIKCHVFKACSYFCRTSLSRFGAHLPAVLTVVTGQSV